MNIKRIHIIIILVLLPLPVLIYEWTAQSFQISPVNIVSGQSDLSKAEFSKQNLYELNGQWWVRSNPSDETSLREVPDVWEPGSTGYRDYVVQLKLPASNKDWGIAVGNLLASNRLIIDGEEFGRSGLPTTTASTTISMNKPYYVYVDGLERPQTIELTVQVANHSLYTGGFIQPLLLGTQEAVEDFHMRERSKDIAVATVASFFSLFFFGMYTQRRGELQYLYFALMALSLSLHSLIFSQRMIYEWLPFLNFSLVGKMQFVNTLSLVFFIKFFRDILHDNWLRRISPWADKIAYALLALFIIVPHSVLTRFAGAVALIIFVVFMLLLTVSVRALFRGSQHAAIILLGFTLPVYVSVKFVFFLLFEVNEFADVNSLNPLIIPLFILTLAIVIARKQQEQETQLLLAAEELIEMDRKKQQFLIRTAHELNNPLQAISNLSHGLAAKQSENADLHIIETTSRRLAFLVKDILDIEMMKSGTYSLQRSAFDLHVAVQTVAGLVKSLRSQPALDIQIEMATGTYHVEMDYDRFQQILFNSLEIVQSQFVEGMIVISACFSTKEPGMIELHMNGMGNGTATNSTEDDLGLAISRDFMAMHGGQMRVLTQEQESFSIELICPAANHELLQTAQIRQTEIALPESESSDFEETPSSHLFELSTVALVYSFSPGMQELQRLLEQDGYRVLAWTNKSDDELMNLFASQSIDLSIIDTTLADTSGLDLCRQIRIRYHQAMLPILMMVGTRPEGLREAAFNAGANDIVEKPYHSLDLLSRVKGLIQMKRTALRLTQSEIAFLRAQIKPHFLYNALNTLMWATDKNPDQSKYLIFHLSNVLRASYHFDSQSQWVSFSDEISVIQSYLIIEKARYGERLEIHYELETEQFSLPPFVLQPLVENALQHGILVKPDGGKLTIGTRLVEREGSGIEVYIEDNGPGITAERFEELISADMLSKTGRGDDQRQGIGLPNVHMRLMRMNNHGLRLEQVAPHGARIVFLVLMGQK